MKSIFDDINNTDDLTALSKQHHVRGEHLISSRCVSVLFTNYGMYLYMHKLNFYLLVHYFLYIFITGTHLTDCS